LRAGVRGAMLTPSFRLALPDPIEPGKAAVGRFDGEHSSLACGTRGGRLFVHSPHLVDGPETNQLSYLNINKEVRSVQVGRVAPELGRDLLLVGTATDLLAYDVEENRDHFFKEVPDGVTAGTVGVIGGSEGPLAVVGGNCSIQGYDGQGNEAFWTVTGDNVSALCFCDVDRDGSKELLAGSDDFEVRVFRDEEAIHEFTESDRVVGLASLDEGSFAYTLANGTVGVYQNLARAWRVKSRHTPTAVLGFDLDGDGVAEVITGWSNGKIEVRNPDTGKVVFRDTLASPIAALCQGDYRNEGQTEVVVCGTSGEVRGYLPEVGDAFSGVFQQADMVEQSIAELSQERQELIFELGTYTRSKTPTGEEAGSATAGDAFSLPMDTEVQCEVQRSVAGGCCTLHLSTSNASLIKGVVAFGEGIAWGAPLGAPSDSYTVIPDAPTPTLEVQFLPQRDAAATLQIRVLVQAFSSPSYHVFDLEHTLGRFEAYLPGEEGGSQSAAPSSGLTARVDFHRSNFEQWVQSRFCVEPATQSTGTSALTLTSVRDGAKTLVTLKPGELSIRTESLELAGDLVQDLCLFIGVEELESKADFPKEVEGFRAVLEKVGEYNATRQSMATDVADQSNLVKEFVARAEDARILGDMQSLRRVYRHLGGVNRDLLIEHTKRKDNHSYLMDALREVNSIIQRGSRLRVGGAKTRVVQSCRNALKKNDVQSLIDIIVQGA